MLGYALSIVVVLSALGRGSKLCLLGMLYL